MRRIFHTWDKWECYPAGFYEERPPNGMSVEEGEEKYREFLSDLPEFERGLKGVIGKWKNSCEHYLSNPNMNRIAWLGQAAIAFLHRVPCCCRGGYNRLTEDQKREADGLALRYLNEWLVHRGEKPLTMEEAGSRTEMDLY